MSITFETTVKNSTRDYAQILDRQLKPLVGKRVLVTVTEVPEVKPIPKTDTGV